MNAPARQPSVRRRWLFRLLAILVGLSPFLLCELSLRAIGWTPEVPAGDPFVDFQNVRPLFIPSDNGQQLVTAPERIATGFFRPESFTAKKAGNEYRIFCLGGSTVQGRPYAIETSFTTWLELSLKAAEPERRWEVINCGGVSYASYRLVPILEEVLRYEPDLIILYTGHNEFLEDRSYAAIKNTPRFAARAYQGLAHLRSMQLVHELARDPDAETGDTSREVLPEDVDALLDYRGGLADYSRATLEKDAVVEHFEYNLRRMIHLAHEANVQVMLVDPPINLRDCPPFKSEDTHDILPANLKRANDFVTQARAMIGSDPARAIEFLEQAARLNPAHAGLRFQLGSLYAEAGRFDAAKRHLLAAAEEDVCPLRLIEPARKAIRQVATETGTPMLKLSSKFETLSEGGMPGNNLFLDHVHPTIGGHKTIAAELMAMLDDMRVIHPKAGWEASRDEAYAKHWDTLDVTYFATGKQRLRGLRTWASGRAKKLRGGGVTEVELPADMTIARWHRPADLRQPIAQFETVFWDIQDNDTLRPILRAELQGSDKRVLEIGTGTGVLALFCLESGAKSVVATDINPAAVANARYNAEHMSLARSLDVRLVPLEEPAAFAVIGSTERFDLIVSNPPWENQSPQRIDDFALYDPGFQLLKSILDGIPAHLTPGGKALLAYGSREGVQQVLRMAPDYGLEARLLDDRKIDTLPDVFVPAVVIEVRPAD